MKEQLKRVLAAIRVNRNKEKIRKDEEGMARQEKGRESVVKDDR